MKVQKFLLQLLTAPSLLPVANELLALLLLCCCMASTTVQAQTGGLPLEPGFAVASCFSGTGANINNSSVSGGFVLAVFDPREPDCATATPNAPDNWTDVSAGAYHHPSWTVDNLGEIFGVTIEEGVSTAPDIFVTSGGINKDPNPALIMAAGGTGGDVFRIDGTTGAITLLASLPATVETTSNGVIKYTGLGNVAHNANDDVLYVSNLDDGMIYVLNATTGATLQVYDPEPSIADVGYYTPILRTVFGIAYNKTEDRLYFSIPTEELSIPKVSGVFSVSLNADGTIDATPKQLEFSKPGAPIALEFPVISDIEFSEDATQMLIAQRSLRARAAFFSTEGWLLKAHFSSTYLYGGATTNWSESQEYLIGSYDAMTNAGGGVDFGYSNYGACGTADACEDAMVATGDALVFPSIYGFQISDINGNSSGFPGNSYFIDLDAAGGSDDKFTNFDVDVFGSTSCAPVACSLTDAGKTLETCNDNSTIPDTADDYITFSLNPTGVGLGTTYTITSDSGTITLDAGGAATGVSYGAVTAFRLQDGSADGATTFTITITDDTDGTCMVTTTVMQTSCSTPCPSPNCGGVTVTQD